MADFNKAIPHILKWEGGYVNDEDDNGGETYRGISRKNNPNWIGWKKIDTLSPKEGDIFPELEDAVKSYYRVAYWNKIFGDNIKNQDVALFLFDWFVNSGYHAIEAVQRITNVRVDGVMGNNTVKAINNYPGNLKEALVFERIKFIKNIVKVRPSQKKFLDGWMNRIDSYA